MTLNLETLKETMSDLNKSQRAMVILDICDKIGHPSFSHPLRTLLEVPAQYISGAKRLKQIDNFWYIFLVRNGSISIQTAINEIKSNKFPEIW